MLQIKDTVVSLDIVERFFLCDLDACLGECCIEGDAGAPITREEYDKIKEVLPQVWNDLLPRAQEEIKENGIGVHRRRGRPCDANHRRQKLCVYLLWRATECACALLKRLTGKDG